MFVIYAITVIQHPPWIPTQRCTSSYFFFSFFFKTIDVSSGERGCIIACNVLNVVSYYPWALADGRHAKTHRLRGGTRKAIYTFPLPNGESNYLSQREINPIARKASKGAAAIWKLQTMMMMMKKWAVCGQAFFFFFYWLFLGLKPSREVCLWTSVNNNSALHTPDGTRLLQLILFCLAKHTVYITANRKLNQATLVDLKMCWTWTM